MDELLAVSDTPLFLDTVITPSGITADQANGGRSAKEDTIYCLVGSKEAYEKYLKGEYRDKKDMESRKYQVLYDIFSDYVTDQSVLSAAVALEYNPEKGLVYGVLYSDKNGPFTYTATNKNGRVNICDRREDYRSEYLIGYYGLD